MIKVEENRELIYKNVISYRGLMTQSEVQERMIEMGNFIKNNDLKINGNIITTTYQIYEDGKFDMEILLPLNEDLIIPSCYKLKKEFKLYNAVYARHEGNPAYINNVYEAMSNYIEENKLQRITSGYNVTVRESSNLDDFIIDVYMGVSNNVL